MTYAEIESYLDHGVLLDPKNIKLTKITMKNGQVLEASFYKMNQEKKTRHENNMKLIILFNFPEPADKFECVNLKVQC